MACIKRLTGFLSHRLPNSCNIDWPQRRWSQLEFRISFSLTPEFKTRFYFPLERLDQMLDGTYSKNISWHSKWKAYLEQFHKLRIDQIKDMLYVCAKRKAMPKDLLTKLRTVHWTSKLAEGSGMDLSVVLHSLAVLTRVQQMQRKISQSENFVLNVLKQASQRNDLKQFSPVALSQCLYSFALFQLKDHPMITIYSAEAAQSNRLKQFNSQSLANILWSWGKLDYNSTHHIKQLSQEVIQQIKVANEQNLANVIWAWGVLEYHDREHWSILVKEMALRKEQLTGQGLATLFVACGRSGFQAHSIFTTLLQHLVLTKKLVLLDSQVLVNIIWSLGKVQYPVRDSNVDSLVQEALKESRLQQYSCQELCCISLGLYGLDYQNRECLDRLSTNIQKEERLEDFTHHELCTLVWCFGKMTVQPKGLQKALSRQIVKGRISLSEYTERGLCNVVLGWAHCIFSEREYTNIIFKEVMKSKRLQKYTCQELANLTWSFGRLKIHSLNLYSKLADEIFLEQNLRSFSIQGLTSILIGWTHGRFYNMQAVERIASEIQNRNCIKDMNEQEIANVCWSLGKLKLQDHAIIKPLSLEIVKMDHLKKFTPQQLSNILLGWSNLKMRDFDYWDKVISEFCSRESTLVLDLPIFHNISRAMETSGFHGLNNYRTLRERGLIV